MSLLETNCLFNPQNSSFTVSLKIKQQILTFKKLETENVLTYSIWKMTISLKTFTLSRNCGHVLCFNFSIWVWTLYAKLTSSGWNRVPSNSISKSPGCKSFALRYKTNFVWSRQNVSEVLVFHCKTEPALRLQHLSRKSPVHTEPTRHQTMLHQQLTHQQINMMITTVGETNTSKELCGESFL